MSLIKKVKIIADLSGNHHNFDIEAFKPISNIKTIIKKITFDLKDIEILYQNKPIDFTRQLSIGEYFSNKSTLIFKIVKTDKNDKINKIKLPFINLKNSYEFNSIYEDSSLIKTGNSETLNRSTNNSGINFFREENDIKANLTYLCECAINFVSFYCRNCKSFICKRCKGKEPHFSHNSVMVNMNNLEDSLNLYCNFLKTDVSYNMKAFTNYTKEFEKTGFLDFTKKKEIILSKLNEIENKQKELLKLVSQSNDSKRLKDFQVSGVKINEEIDEIFSRISKEIENEKKINFEKSAKYFIEFNKIENKILDINEFILNFKINYEINKNFDINYRIIEKAVDALLSNDFNLFGQYKFIKEDIFSPDLLDKYRIQFETFLNNLKQESLKKSDKTNNQEKKPTSINSNEKIDNQINKNEINSSKNKLDKIKINNLQNEKEDLSKDQSKIKIKKDNQLNDQSNKNETSNIQINQLDQNKGHSKIINEIPEKLVKDLKTNKEDLSKQKIIKSNK